VVGDAGIIVTSPDGISWTSRSSGTTNSLTSVSFGGGEYVAVGASGMILTSNDGITWTSRLFNTTNNLSGVCYDGNGQFVIVGDSGTIIGN